MKRGLLLRVRERPGGLPATLLPEHEAQLLRRPQPLRMVWAEGRAGLLERQRAEHVLAKEAVFAADLLDLPHCHNPRALVHRSVTSRGGLKRAARRRTSGLAQEFPHRDIHPIIRAVVDAYGPDRVSYGSDWPNMLETGVPYDYAINTIDEALRLSAPERDQVFGETAARVWNFAPAVS